MDYWSQGTTVQERILARVREDEDEMKKRRGGRRVKTESEFLAATRWFSVPVTWRVSPARLGGGSILIPSAFLFFSFFLSLLSLPEGFIHPTPTPGRQPAENYAHQI